ncbi:hypothetical protein RCO48_04665 [Peribacillus frigoritolerans]|nr:hypothetical protein [Peribacillus frigoritolerans]
MQQIPKKAYKHNNIALTDVKVWNIIDGGNNSTKAPTVIAHKGDEIKINAEDRTVYKKWCTLYGEFIYRFKFPNFAREHSKKHSLLNRTLGEADWYSEYRPTNN